ncbi:hypothetical protein QRX60_41545 [Amycolatopsis mongoliensis]|uniref:Uncharacterized protein n=1 Tax=Amycolatopsis mongoliensis TaxID=715475 RepID=A0A9Y2NG66_9PSEU|nr:hypothetical protein [Amycolatopsis sp. 4-36]WIY00479.1 hypothetical protein QRX60_41545 [Amycolatopsis sp. 4-36]
MDAHDVMLCERCWYPISPNGDHVVREYRDETHPLLAPLTGYFHVEDDPACRAARSARVTVVHDVRAVPVVVDRPPRRAAGDEQADRRPDPGSP